MPAAPHAGGVAAAARRGLSAADRRAVLRQELDRIAAGGKADAETQNVLARAFGGLYQPRALDETPAPVVQQTIVDQFHRLYYHASKDTWRNSFYRGTRLYKCPTDMWIYQEIITSLKPGLVIETGTFCGGSALFIADLLELNGRGEVVTVDVKQYQDEDPTHPRLTYLKGSSIAEEIVADIAGRLPTDGSPVLVILDSLHDRDHVAAELQAYASMVTPGSYVIVEDTNVNGHPAAPDYGPGPFEAAQQFLATTDDFEVDPWGERFYLTQNPSGYLRRKG